MKTRENVTDKKILRKNTKSVKSNYKKNGKSILKFNEEDWGYFDYADNCFLCIATKDDCCACPANDIEEYFGCPCPCADLKGYISFEGEKNSKNLKVLLRSLKRTAKKNGWIVKE